MAAESPIRMLESDETKTWLPTTDSGLQTRMGPNRSGSAPPTVEGSIAAFQAFMDQRNSSYNNSSNDVLDCESEEEMRIDPSYIVYYYANVKMNPRLPPPLISPENRRLVQFMGGISNKKNSVTEGLLATHNEEPEEAVSPNKILGNQKESLVHGTHHGSWVDPREVEFVQAPSLVSRTAVKGENDHDIHTISTADQVSKMQESCSVSVDKHNMNTTNHSVSSASYCRNVDLEESSSIQSNIGSDISVVESRMQLLDVSGEIMGDDDQKRRDQLHLHDEHRLLPHPSQDTTYQLPGFQTYAMPRGTDAVHQKVLPVHQSFMHNPGFVPPLYASTAAYMNPGNLFYPSVPQPGFPSPQSSLGGFSVNSIFPPFGGYFQQNPFPIPVDAYPKTGFFKQPIEALPGETNPYTNQFLRPPFGGPLQGQDFQPFYEDAQRRVAQCQLDNLALRNDSDVASSIVDKKINYPAIEKASMSSPTSGTHISVTYYGYPPNLKKPHFPAPSPALPGSPVSSNNHQGIGNERSASQQPLKAGAAFSGSKGQRGPESSDNHNSKRHSFLEILKSCSSKTLELSDISGQIVEFSTDQHGSRFIQQKLENCGSNEKESVFNEVLPQASKLMTDVFGNYVVQKFFEYGTDEQRRRLGQQLSGQILTLSLQMYGCRVIQKALEVIELDQKVELVKELSGHVMRCVHDQNGNHVIQKCIESVPIEKIKFIISSFTGQVANLSCHPYGCRVIQRLLEHCSDEQISQWLVDEILKATSNLAQDPYGNYVTQHVLEMGQPHQRSQIIHKLTGQFVQLSQHKFASNVVEKCIKYGNVSERNLIIEEIIAPSDNDEALLMMMKDQFANYVVQKIFEIGSEKQKNTLQKFIQSHLPTLKKVTYAKHIVSRYEQLAEVSEQDQKQCAKMKVDSISSTSE